jgi:transglutaminase-like putative cysteine protease
MRWWDLPAASLLLVAILTAASRLVATRWTEHMAIVQTIATIATLSGLALGQSRFSSRVAAFILAVYGLFIVPWQLGMTVDGDLPWVQRMDSLGARLQVIIAQLTNHAVVQDSLLFIVLMAVMFWVLGTLAGYSLTRHGNAWLAILPTGLALFVIHAFDALIAPRAWYLAVYIFFGLVLVARAAYLKQHDRWQQSRTALPPHLGLDFIRFALLATALLVVLSWTAPAFAGALPAAEKVYTRIKQPWYELRDRVDNAFASLRSSVGIVSDYYGDSVMLGRGNQLTGNQVFQVIVPSNAPTSLRFYWRARTYDSYQNGQWLNTVAHSQSFDPAGSVVLPTDSDRWLGTFDFVTSAPLSTLFVPPQPLWVSVPAMAEAAVNLDASKDVTAFRANPPLEAGVIYMVQASLTNASVTQLRKAGTDYPAWVVDRYLQLPDTITDRTRQLAQRITAELETPYDKAAAITSYLRDTIPYSDVVPEQPSGQDSVDWFLFDLQKGFCNYYASAEVVLLRSLGIPARFAVGYAQGERQADGRYLVRQKDAHAWPEVYFTGLGWVEFEPTASQPTVVRAPGTAGDPAQDSNLPDNGDLERQQLAEQLALQRANRGGGVTPTPLPAPKRPSLLFWLIPLVLALVLLGLAFRFRGRINLQPAPIWIERSMLRAGLRPPQSIRLWARRAGLPPLTRAYLEINHALARLGQHPAATATPAERSAALIQAIPQVETQANRLVTEYQVGIFSPQPADTQAAHQAGLEIRRLSYKELVRRLFSRLQRPTRGSLQPARKG